MGKHTGTRVIEVKLTEQGITATGNELEMILDNVKKQGETNGSVSDEEFWEIANRILNAG